MTNPAAPTSHPVARRRSAALILGRVLLVVAGLLWLVFVGPLVVSSVGPGTLPEWLVEPLLIASAVLFVVASVLMISHAVLLAGERDLERLWPAAITVKIVAIPFFVANFFFWYLVVASLLFFGIGFLIWPFAVAITYLALLPTSAYGIACIVVLKQRRAVSTAFVVVNVLLHLCFVLDIASAAVVALRAQEVSRAARRAAGPPAISARGPGG